MNLNGCMATSGRMAMQSKPCRAACISSSTPTYCFGKAKCITIPNAKNWRAAPQELEQLSLRGIAFICLKCSIVIEKVANLTVLSIHKAHSTSLDRLRKLMLFVYGLIEHLIFRICILVEC